MSVTINGDTAVEGDETFLLNLTGASSGVSIADGQGVGTILNDDVPPPAPAMFRPAFLGVAAFGADPSAGGWSSDDQYRRELGDVNGDGRADIVGFGAAGVYVAPGNVDGSFQAPVFSAIGFGSSPSSGGWSSGDRYPRELGDVNGDGRADIVGFGAAGVYVALGKIDGSFEAPVFRAVGFGSEASAGGWASDDRYPRELADVNGDGRADIVGFGAAGVYVAPGNPDGSFGAPIFSAVGFGASPSAGGWASDDQYPRELDDVNNDGRADIVGFGAAGPYVSLGNIDGTFQAPTFQDVGFGASPSAGGWASDDRYPRELADVNGDGGADIVGFGAAGAYVSLATGFLIA